MPSQAIIELLVRLKDEAKEGISGIGSALGNIGDAARGAQAIFGAIEGAGQALFGEAMQAQEGMAQLDAVLASTGGKAGVTRDQVLALSNSLSASNGLSKYADDAVLASENLLLTFTNIGSTTFPRAAQAAVDMAAKLGGEPVAQSVALGKALNDPVKGVTA